MRPCVLEPGLTSSTGLKPTLRHGLVFPAPFTLAVDNKHKTTTMNPALVRDTFRDPCREAAYHILETSPRCDLCRSMLHMCVGVLAGAGAGAGAPAPAPARATWCCIGFHAGVARLHQARWMGRMTLQRHARRSLWWGVACVILLEGSTPVLGQGGARRAPAAWSTRPRGRGRRAHAPALLRASGEAQTLRVCVTYCL